MIKIAGYQKTTLQDYPGHISSIVFTQGCNFRCGYCHNPDLIPFDCEERCMDCSEIFSHLKKRSKVIEGVVITGGEPTIQTGLLEFIEKIKGLGLKVKIDTNGSNPAMLKDILKRGLLDYVAMDYKYPSKRYPALVNVDLSSKSILASRDIIIQSGVPHEFRVTIIESLFSEGVIEEIGRELSKARTIVLQGFNNTIVYDSSFRKYPKTHHNFLEHVRNILIRYNQRVIIRD